LIRDGSLAAAEPVSAAALPAGDRGYQLWLGILDKQQRGSHRKFTKRRS
jgi:hypothetical protein